MSSEDWNDRHTLSSHPWEAPVPGGWISVGRLGVRVSRSYVHSSCVPLRSTWLNPGAWEGPILCGALTVTKMRGSRWSLLCRFGHYKIIWVASNWRLNIREFWCIHVVSARMQSQRHPGSKTLLVSFACEHLRTAFLMFSTSCPSSSSLISGSENLSHCFLACKPAWVPHPYPAPLSEKSISPWSLLLR